MPQRDAILWVNLLCGSSLISKLAPEKTQLLTPDSPQVSGIGINLKSLFSGYEISGTKPPLKLVQTVKPVTQSRGGEHS